MLPSPLLFKRNLLAFRKDRRKKGRSRDVSNLSCIPALLAAPPRSNSWINLSFFLSFLFSFFCSMDCGQGHCNVSSASEGIGRGGCEGPLSQRANCVSDHQYSGATDVFLHLPRLHNWTHLLHLFAGSPARPSPPPLPHPHPLPSLVCWA